MGNMVLSILITLVLIVPGQVLADRAIPDSCLAYPAHISLNNSSMASGFFLNDGTNVYLVTAKHALFNIASGKLSATQATITAYSSNPHEEAKNILSLDLSILSEAKNIRRHPTADVATVCIAKVLQTDEYFNLKTLPGITYTEKASTGIFGTNIDTVKFFKNVLIANTIYMFGYPTSIGIKRSPQFDLLRPLLRSGIVAGINPKLKTIILDCPSYPGNSGGPVLEMERISLKRQQFRIIGVVSQFIPFAETWVNKTHGYTNTNFSNSGYCVAVSMDPVIELIKYSQQTADDHE
ncbi:MAG: hypothetical protein SCALA701_02180 [Candidatus Scalindua sp.]|nr:trypsin-like peptidase domain-containing protein [Planctomycetota bacterium]GJQ57417.1 MAG: hypothetical protein SCALA701_02180 [Candidatus Scalindua sp.]